MNISAPQRNMMRTSNNIFTISIIKEIQFVTFARKLDILAQSEKKRNLYD